MPITLIQATLTASSGIAEDDIQNNWVMSHAALSPTPGNTLPWTGPISNFYDDISPYLGSTRSRNAGAVRYKLYDITAFLSGGNYGSPVATDTSTLVSLAGGAKDLPEEVACVLTLRGLGWDGTPVEAPDGADPGVAPDRPRSRRAGRLYIGPLRDNTQNTFGNRPLGTFTTAVRTAYLNASADATGQGTSFRVWSRQDGVTRHVVAVQTDDAFDTQRRRGVAPTARLTTVVV